MIQVDEVDTEIAIFFIRFIIRNVLMGLPRGAVNDCLLHAALFFKEPITYVVMYAFLGFYRAFLLYG